MMTNNQIVEWCVANLKMKQLIRNCQVKNVDDLQQYIYLTLLEYDNTKLNEVFNNNYMKAFVIRMILNQRNYYRSDYNLNYKLDPTKDDVSNSIFEPIDYADEPDAQIEFIDEYFNTYENEREWFDKKIYKLKVTHGETLTSLSNKTKISRTTINQSIQKVKNDCKDKWNKQINKKDDN